MDVDGPLWAVADPAHVVHVLDALLSNAGTYGRPPVVLPGRTDGDGVVLVVCDDGDGVPADIAPRVFTPFEQADRGDRRRSRGVGLGLSVVRTLCRRMGGSVRLCDDTGDDTGLGAGACFEVRLPRTPVEGMTGSHG